MRELYEETGQTVNEMYFEGLLKMKKLSIKFIFSS
ncbi:hypothetical protein [Sutcliffiella cohnii]